MTAWYKNNMADFVARDVEDIVGTLVSQSVGKIPSDMVGYQRQSWRNTINGLIQTSKTWMQDCPEAREWSVLLEYELPRRNRRIDAVILARNIVILIEFKDESIRFTRSDRWQAEQYALDLRDFHLASRGREIVPFLVATRSEGMVSASPLADIDLKDAGKVSPLGLVNYEGLATQASLAYLNRSNSCLDPIDPDEWETSEYRPAPWIVDAARDIYQKQDVREIKSAGSHNLDETVASVIDLVRECRSRNRHGIVFITGAPGSGKTLAGLQVVHDAALATDEGDAVGVFLSGNMPLVEVIRGAIASDNSYQGSKDLSRAEKSRRIETFIQHAYQFRNEYAYREDKVPPEHVILFDEAQRAWDAHQVQVHEKGRGNPVRSFKSEPELFLEIMARVSDWAVIIAVVGSGQEINRGEAGLGEWGKAIADSDIDWLVKVSPHVIGASDVMAGSPLINDGKKLDGLIEDPRLHLEMNVRSPRAEALNRWVDAVIDFDPKQAEREFSGIGDFPLVMTRNLDQARSWLWDRTNVREKERCGLVGNRHARRLRAWGLDVSYLRANKAWADWYLKPHDDVRSSNRLEVPANAFDCQGLELDWVGMCWGSDLIVNDTNDAWAPRQFSGSRWLNVNKEDAVIQHLNSYRVLLTRARKGMVIWVPEYSGDDPTDTLHPEILDHIAALLLRSGVPCLDD